MNPVLLSLLGAVAGGAALAVQSGVNGRLGRALADPVAAACVSFATGLLILIAAAALRWNGLDWRAAAALPWWAWGGGALGALYLVAIIAGVPHLGVLTLVGAVVLGQVAAAIAIDATGAFGVPVHPVSWGRVAAAALIVAGLLLSRA